MDARFEPLHRLLEHGQSYWLDNLTRARLRGGELAERVAQQGLRGVTSNPAIFHKAITARQRRSPFAALRAELREKCGVATTLGFGRDLHSTGQIPQGRFRHRAVPADHDGSAGGRADGLGHLRRVLAAALASAGV